LEVPAAVAQLYSMVGKNSPNLSSVSCQLKLSRDWLVIQFQRSPILCTAEEREIKQDLDAKPVKPFARQRLENSPLAACNFLCVVDDAGAKAEYLRARGVDLTLFSMPSRQILFGNGESSLSRKTKKCRSMP
jgi:hypothetical protein